MRRLGVEFQPEANADLAGIFRIVLRASQNSDVAEGFLLLIMRRCERIGDAPHGGRPRDDLDLGLRTVAFERTVVIAYRVDGDRVRIANVFYGGGDFEALYLSLPGGDDR